MINIFGWTIVRTKNYEWWVKEAIKCQIPLQEEEPTLHCGYKSCDFTTKYESGLKRHRTRMHRRKTS